MAIVTERGIATIYVRTYEFGYKQLGPFLLIGAIAATITVMLVLYQYEKFDGLYLNARVLPAGTAPVANTIIIVMLFVNLLALISTIALRLVNKRRLIKATLSSTFQSKENRTTSNLLFWIASIQFATFVLTDIITLSVRVFLSQSRYITAFKENADLFNFYTIFLPFFTTVYYRRVRQRCIRDIRNNLNIKAIGSEGWKNYSAVTQERWK
ncbi:hypothetical protein OESDEN_23833 [Oesophagostomum dentatum]|uniref:Uncharacterized protein n=1 Tax=Oesophagostomum dentatum TaxID=61180 RepID=A0A0B1RZ98_OESDE|nr:hypothetical protein OESDEN_23833 [Oesophagostomum dentatum]